MKEKTTGSENEFDDITIVEVWMNAIPYRHFEIYKKDYCGSIMFFDDYSNYSEYGWMIEYIQPFSKGGTDDITNLRAVHWKNTVSAHQKQELLR